MEDVEINMKFVVFPRSLNLQFFVWSLAQIFMNLSTAATNFASFYLGSSSETSCLLRCSNSTAAVGTAAGE